MVSKLNGNIDITPTKEEANLLMQAAESNSNDYTDSKILEVKQPLTWDRIEGL